MRVVVTADLHWGSRSSGDEATEMLAQAICNLDADALVIAGDIAVPDPRKVVECLELFSGFTGAKLVVAGNHDLWTKKYDSWRIWNRLFPEAASLGGFHCLDRSPFMLDRLAFVGSVGWYDYSFADPSLKIPYWQYVTKTYGTWQWNDVNYIVWDHTDPSFTSAAIDRLIAHLDEIRESCDTIIGVVHHPPFAELITHRDERTWSFGNAFMGSRKLGQMLAGEAKMRAVICGHSHERLHAHTGNIALFNVGSTYVIKRYDLIEISADGAHLLDSGQFQA